MAAASFKELTAEGRALPTGFRAHLSVLPRRELFFVFVCFLF